MTVQDAVFVLIAVAGGISAIQVVTSRNLVHAALFLGATLASIAGVFLVLHADFLGLVQLLIYVGAITVLLLFGLMLTRAPIGREALDSRQRGLGLGVAVALFGVLTALLLQTFQGLDTPTIGGPTAAELGEALFATWVLPFELLSLLLLAALIGAVVLSRRQAGETGEPEAPSRIEMSEPPPGELPPAGGRPVPGRVGERPVPAGAGVDEPVRADVGSSPRAGGASSASAGPDEPVRAAVDGAGAEAEERAEAGGAGGERREPGEGS